jgi:hypothetical protein
MDAVSDRDFAVEFCAAGALLAVHLSRLAEDVILWAGAEFNFIKIADAYTTGSSLMPQKKNPDIAELARGKTGRVFGNLMSLLTLLKGLPMTYNRDLQEDKERLFDTADTVRASTRIFSAMLRNIKINRAACAAAASDPALLATDLADYLVKKGMPFRQAHHVVGAVVALAEKTGKPLNQLTLAELQGVNPTFGRDALGVFKLSENGDGETKPDRRTGNKGSREATGALAGTAFVNSYCTANKKPDALAGVRLCVFRDLCFWRGLGLRGGRRLGGAGGRAVGHVEPVFAELLFAAFEQAEQHVARGGHEPAHGVLVQLAGLTERDVALLRRLFRLLIQIIG